MPKKQKRVLPDRRFLLPEKVRNHWEYPALRVVKIPTKGNEDGVIALEDIKPNTILYYEGKRIDQDEFDELVEKLEAQEPDDQKYVSYILESGASGVYVDANPRYRPWSRTGHRGMDIGGKVNEPATGETENMLFSNVTDEKGVKHPVLVAVRDIERGEELLVHYGSSYKRIGYKVGRRAKMPSWWKRRNQAPVAVD